MAPEEGAAVHDVGGGATSSVEDRHELRNPGYEIFIAALSILSIANILLEFLIIDAALDSVLNAMNAILSGILFVDFLVRLRTASSRSDYFFRRFGWADLLASLPLPQLKILRLFRLARVYRLLKAYGARNIGRSMLRERAGSALLSLLFVAILVLEFGSLWMLRIESSSHRAQHHHRLGRDLVRHRHDLDRRLRRPVPGDDPRQSARGGHHRAGRRDLRHPHRLPRQPLPVSDGIRAGLRP